MTPIIVQNAFAPKGVEICGVELQPLTAKHVLTLDRAKAWNWEQNEPNGEPWLSLGILSAKVGELEDGTFSKEYADIWRAVAARVQDECEYIATALCAHINTAFAPYLPVRPPNGERTLLAQQTIGLVAELVEVLMHEYHLTFEDALATPLARAFVLLAANAKRNGLKFAAPDYTTAETEEKSLITTKSTGDTAASQ